MSDISGVDTMNKPGISGADTALVSDIPRVDTKIVPHIGVDGAVIECGLCLRHDKSLDKPHIAPCKHVQCLPCLQKCAEIHKRYQCLQPNCREVFDEKQLSEFPLTSSSNQPCEKCSEKKFPKPFPTEFFCIQCSVRLCTSHKKEHDSWHKAHTVMGISDYDAQSTRLERRPCKTHNKEVYTDGCMECLMIACSKCVRTSGRCYNDQIHHWQDIDMLVGKLKPEMKEQIQRMSSKLQQHAEHFNSLQKTLQEFDASTAKQLQELEESEKDKISRITTEYHEKKLELKNRRSRDKERLKRFTEENLQTRITELKSSILMLSTRIEHSHNLDIVKTYGEMKWRVKFLIEADLPTVQPNDPKMAPAYGEYSGKSDSEPLSDLSLGLCFSLPAECDINDDDGVTNLPSLELEKTVRLKPLKPRFTCYFRGAAYIASDSICDIKHIDCNSQIRTCYILRKPPCGISVSGNLTYIMGNSSPPMVHVLHQRNEENSWKVASTQSVNCRFTIIADELVILDGCDKTLLVYSLEGTHIRTVQLFGKLSDHRLNSICSCNDGDVLISDYTSSRVFKVSVRTGDVRWSRGIVEPVGIACDNKHVFVATFRRNLLHILDLKAGRKMSEIEINGLNNEGTVNVHVSEETLVVTRYSEGKAMFFKIRYGDVTVHKHRI